MEKSKTKLLFVNDHLGFDNQLHGVGRMLQVWTTHLDTEKFDITVCILNKKDNLSRIFEEKGVKTLFLGKGKYNPTTILALAQIIRKERIDILHLQGYRGATFGRLASILTGVSVLVQFHDTIGYYPWIQKVSDRLLGRLTDLYIAVSNSVRDVWIERGRIDREDIIVLPNCTALADFEPLNAEDLAAEKKRLGIEPYSKVVGTVARLHEHKGIRFLLQAAPLVLKAFPKTVFVIVGDGPQRVELEELTDSLGLRQNVLFTGYVENVAPVLGTFDINVLPSIYKEGFGLSVLEGMAMEKPTVVTNTVEFVQDGIDGLIVPPENSDLLAEKIVWLLSNEKQAKSMGTAARQASEKFDVSHVVRELEDIYSSLLVANQKSH